MKIRKCFARLAAVFFLLLFVFGADRKAMAGEERVFDQAGIFSQEEKAEFEEKAQALEEKMNMAVAILTTDDAKGQSAGTYAENFYIGKKLGVGEDYSGVIFSIDLDNRELYIAPVGKMNRYLTDKRWNAILDEAYEGASEGEYGECVRSFLNGVSKYYEAGIPSGQYNYDQNTGQINVYRSIRWYECLLAVLAAFGAAAGVCAGVKREYSMKKQRSLAENSLTAYRADCSLQFTDKTDHLIGKTVTHVIVPKENHGGGGPSAGNRSTTHSSSGRSFGGGGRKF